MLCLLANVAMGVSIPWVVQADQQAQDRRKPLQSCTSANNAHQFTRGTIQMPSPCGGMLQRLEPSRPHNGSTCSQRCLEHTSWYSVWPSNGASGLLYALPPTRCTSSAFCCPVYDCAYVHVSSSCTCGWPGSLEAVHAASCIQSWILTGSLPAIPRHVVCASVLVCS